MKRAHDEKDKGLRKARLAQGIPTEADGPASNHDGSQVSAALEPEFSCVPCDPFAMTKLDKMYATFICMDADCAKLLSPIA